jgi:hypothetical protein
MKSNYFDEKAKRLKQEIKVLVSRPAFQKEVAILREKWNIPSEGIKTEDDNQEWHHKLDIATDEYRNVEWPKCRAEIDRLNKERKFREAEEKRKEHNAKAPLNEFREDIWSVVRKYRLSPRWHNAIRRYILFNDPDNLNLAAGVTIVNTWENGMKLIALEIDGDTTLKDIKQVWPWVKRMQKDLMYKRADKFQPIKNFERDKRIYELEQGGKTLTEIAELINVEFDSALLETEVKQIIKRYKKRLNIN